MKEKDYELGRLDGDDRLTIARLDAPPAVLQVLARDPYPEVRKEVARNPKTPLEALLALAKDPDWRVRLALAQGTTPEHPHRRALEETLVRLLEDKDPYVRQEAAMRVHTFDPKQLKDVIVRQGFAANRFAPPGLLRRLAEDVSFEVRRRVSGNPSTPVEVLRSLSADPLYHEAIASNPSCPRDLLLALLERGNSRVRRAAAGNEALPEELLRELAKDPDPDVREAVARNKGASAELLDLLGEDKSWEVRWAVAERRDAPKEVIAKLLMDTSPSVHEAALYNPSCPKEALARVLTPLGVALRMGAREFVAYALENLEEIAGDDEAFLRLLLHLEEIPEDADLWLRIGELAGKRKALLRFHPFSRQIWTLFALAS